MCRSEDYKGHRQVIEAWPTVLARVPDAQLWIVGEGDLRPDLEQLAVVKGVEGNVRFWGALSDAEKEKLIASCRCLVMPSRGEGFGLVYLEAMRLGRPCLVSTFDAGREVVNPPEAGLAVDPGDTRQVAEAICRLLSHTPECSQWSVQARRRYESNFTAEKFQNRLISAISQN
jgi:phosphatidylinositol alpha-1,6-mannosyltransferase